MSSNANDVGEPSGLQPNQSQRKNNNKDKRSNKRKETFRFKKSTAEDAKQNKALSDKLYHGFKNINDTLLNMQITTNPRSIILPTSTRAIGFMVRFLISKFARLQIRNINFHETCCALYRVTLLMFEAKLNQALANQMSTNTGRRQFRSLTVTVEQMRALGQLNVGFSPLINLISSIGVFKAFGCQFIPRLLNELVHNQLIVYDPTLVTFSNLRNVVVYLSNEVNNQEARAYFYNHSPLPNALWNHRNRRELNNPVLANPNDIMPADYGENNLRNDILTILDALDVVNHKYSRYVAEAQMDYNALGNATQLVSNQVENIRCVDLHRIGDVVNYTNPPIDGTIEDFWASEAVTDSEFYLGAMHLFGEPPQLMPDGVFNERTIDCSKIRASMDYSGSLINMLT